MLDQLKKILNEDQDPKAIEKITAKLSNLLMTNEEVGYIAVQKKPAITVLPDSIIVTNKRIITCKPKNLGLSMAFVDYDWEDVAGAFMKEGILGAEFTFNTKSDLIHTVDYLPKNQARKLYTFAKEQLELLKKMQKDNPTVIEETTNEEATPIAFTKTDINETFVDESFDDKPVQEETTTEEVTHYAEIIPHAKSDEQSFEKTASINDLNSLTKDQLFEKLQNYKKLLDNGLILQGEYDRLKDEVLKLM